MAMICMDVNNCPRSYAFTRELEKTAKSNRIICIMGAFSDSGWLYGSAHGETLSFTSPHAHNTRIVMADAIETGPSSFLTDTDWTVVACAPKCERHVNQIIMTEI